MPNNFTDTSGQRYYQDSRGTWFRWNPLGQKWQVFGGGDAPPSGYTPPEPKVNAGADGDGGSPEFVSAGGGSRRGGSLIGGALRNSPTRGSNFSDQTGTNYSYHTLFALSMAFIIVWTVRMNAVRVGDTKQTTGILENTLDGQAAGASLWGWLFLFIVLLSASSFKATQALAAAFSWLLFISVLLINGTPLATAILHRITPPVPNPTQGSSGGSIKKN